MLCELYVSGSFYLDELVKMISVHCRMGADFGVSLMPYGELWRKHRKLFHEHLQSSMIPNYIPIQRRKVHDFLHQLLVTPDNFLPHIRQ